MATTITVPRVARPVSEGMFADLGVPHVDIDTVVDAAGATVITVTVPVDLTGAQVLRGRIRLLTASQAEEDDLVAAVGALNTDDTYLALASPTQAQAVAQVRALTQQVRGLIRWVGRDALGLGG